MARVVAFIPDLLFGSSVLTALQGAGHEAVLVSDVESLRRGLPGAEIVVIDLTFDAADRIEQARSELPAGARTLAFYSHVDADVRARAEQAGFDLVVPRSRMAREGPALVQRLAASGG